jgi:FKBP-type peptidyl-prolyl cis-trans isomerase SlpA
VNRIQPGSFVTLHYRLADADGLEVVNTFSTQPSTLTLGCGQLAPAIEARLLGLDEGARARFELPPGEAFGQRNPELLQRVKRSLLAQAAEPGTGAQSGESGESGEVEAGFAVGEVLHFPTPDGQAQYAGVVREVGPEALLLDFNHPLAGRGVSFEVHVLGVLP